MFDLIYKIFYWFLDSVEHISDTSWCIQETKGFGQAGSFEPIIKASPSSEFIIVRPFEIKFIILLLCEREVGSYRPPPFRSQFCFVHIDIPFDMNRPLSLKKETFMTYFAKFILSIYLLPPSCGFPRVPGWPHFAPVDWLLRRVYLWRHSAAFCIILHL
jgi:hypothetical protein